MFCVDRKNRVKRVKRKVMFRVQQMMTNLAMFQQAKIQETREEDCNAHSTLNN